MHKTNKSNKPDRRTGGGTALMQQMGFQIPNFDGSGMNDDDDDNDLEAELLRLQQDDGYNPRSRGSKSNQQISGGMAQDLESFHKDVNKLLHNIDQPSNDDDISDVDEDELLAELNEITDEIQTDRNNQNNQPQPKSSGNLVSLLEGRQDMYLKAIASAKANGDATKSRRYDRQLKTIQDLLQSARSGAPIDESEIPPEVFIGSQAGPVSQQVPIRAPSPPRPPAVQPQPPAPRPRAVPLPQAQVPVPPTSVRIGDRPAAVRPQAPSTFSDADPAVARLKSLALQARQQGDMAKAKEYIIQLRALQNKGTTTAPPTSVPKETYDNVNEDEAPPIAVPLKAPEPRTVMEALQQRYDELTKRGEEAARSGDSSKARRMERLTKQYEEAMDATRKGRPYNYNELPDLPGFAPIPVQQLKTQSSPSATAGNPANTQVRPGQQQRPVPAAAPPPANSITARKNRQIQQLREKQEKFRQLALKAKQKGDLETAKLYLSYYKRFEPMISAAENGLPIDLSQVPKLPDDDNSDMIDDDDLTQDLAHADRDTIFRRLQDDLLRQVQLCARNQQLYAQMEGMASVKQANDYKNLEQRCSNDLEKLRYCFQHGFKPPLFHYEKRQMNVVHVNNDLGDNDLEVTILRGINLPVPTGFSSSSLETYVVIEFPYPTEAPQTARTRHTVGSDNAEYPESTHKFYIKRNDAKFKRLMGRKELKLAVLYKPGFLRSDRLLGTAALKLCTLEQTCTIHESVDLYEGEHKKKIEGKLEVKIRIKEALTQTKSSDALPQRWLVIDRFEDLESKPKSSKSSGTAPPPITAIACLKTTGDALGQLAVNMARKNDDNDTIVDNSRPSAAAESSSHQHRRSHAQKPEILSATNYPQSVQVLNYEASLIEQQIEQLRDRLTDEQIRQLKMKRRDIERESNQLVESLRMGGKRALEEHVRNLESLCDHYDREAREYHQRRETRKADLALTKMKLVMKEMDTLTGQSSSTRF